MSSAKFLALAAFILVPTLSHAAAARSYSSDEIAVQEVSKALVQNDLKFVTSPTSNICGTTGLEGTDVKVQIAAGGRFITIRHYGVTYAGYFSREKAISCAQ